MRRLRQVRKGMPCGGHQHGGKGRCTVKSTRKKRWSDYLWIAELCYLFLGLFNILFAWLGMLFFCIPLFRTLLRIDKPVPACYNEVSPMYDYAQLYSCQAGAMNA